MQPTCVIDGSSTNISALYASSRARSRFSFLDDVLVASRSPEEHREHLRFLFQRFEAYGLRIKASKYIFVVAKLNFLGHEITAKGIRPMEERVQTILEFPIPTFVRAAQRFNGMVNFYQRFVPNLAKLLQRIHNHLTDFQLKHKSEQVKLDWPEDCNSAFDQVKQSPANA